jgi:mannose-6-phosphate isomerase-like protein (cupin superfamily)
MTIAETIILGPGEGKSFSLLGTPHTLKAVGSDTGGAYALCELAAPAAAPGPPPHVHEHEDEAFYVLEGELTVRIGERTVTAAAGTFAFAPRGVVHSFSNAGSKPARALLIISPAGFEKALEEIARVAPPGERPPDVEKLTEIASRYGVRIVPPE